MPAESPSQPARSHGAGLLPESIPAVLALADGTVFHGRSIGAPGRTVGEVVFNTAMTGYQEILTDPSYCRQIVTLTYPHIGNYGVNAEDVEAAKIHAAGLVVKDVPELLSNWRSVQTLPEYLRGEGVPGIAGIDTRKLVRRLREAGAQAGCLVAAAQPGETIDEHAAIDAARAFPGLAGMDLAREVSAPEPYRWSEGSWRLGAGFGPAADKRYRVVAFDYGVKRNILRLLADRGCEVVVLPAQASAAQALALKPDGVFLSNGPGDPAPCDYAIGTIRELIDRDIPVFGICLGHQLVGLASGAKTMKLKFGHHGANHPVRNLDTGKVHITSQNHGFAVDPASLPPNLRVTHVSLFDGSIQGLERTDHPVFCFQGHPEASPGPQDIHYLFDRFIDEMEKRR
ncbi:MAG: glutamine-hydrolyzing carbamoyl-phosphate synthase small subunit [Burkholderiaceae bacterium]|nr:glutamine-hydrolyzing carbamoyl-phosphate synthase small subunit [Burkholderiaceae bacterium]